MDLYPANILTDSPAAYWRLGELVGTTAADSSGNAIDGTASGAVTPGLAGAIRGNNDAAAGFGGTTSVITAPALGSLSAWTIEAWIMRNGAQPALSGVMADAYSGVCNWILGFNEFGFGDGQIFGGFFDGGAWRIVGPGNVTDGAWTHVACAFDGGTLRLFVDGSLAATAPASSSSGGSVASYIGGNLNGAGATSSFVGLIDEVAVYATALSADRIAAHYRSGIATAFAPRRVGMSGGFDL